MGFTARGGSSPLERMGSRWKSMVSARPRSCTRCRAGGPWQRFGNVGSDILRMPVRTASYGWRPAESAVRGQRADRRPGLRHIPADPDLGRRTASPSTDTPASRPLRSSARLSLGRSLSAQCGSAGGVSHQPSTYRSHARPMKLSGASICRASGAISPMALCGKRPTRCRPVASSVAATRSSSSRVNRWEGRQASCFTCSRW